MQREKDSVPAAMALDSIDPSLAMELAKAGAMLLCLNVPKGTLFGIDYMSYTVGDKFQGVKMVPPGVHFVYYAAHASPSSHQTAASGIGARVGEFVVLESAQVWVRTWDTASETLVALESADSDRYAAGARRFEFDSGMGPYPLDTYAQWKRLSKYISPAVVRKLSGGADIAGFKPASFRSSRSMRSAATPAASAASMSTMDTTSPTSSTAGSGAAPAASQDSPALGGPLSFGYSVIPVLKPAANAPAAEVTRMHMDKSGVLSMLLREQYGNDSLGLLGELQHAFIAFLLCEMYDAFEHWKALVLLLCSCEEAISQPLLARFWAGFCEVLHGHISEAPKDFFIDPLSQNNFLVHALRSFFSIIFSSAATYDIAEPSAAGSMTVMAGDRQATVTGQITSPPGLAGPVVRAIPAEVTKQARALKALMLGKFGWDYDRLAHNIEEDDEYAPAVVDLESLSDDLRRQLQL